MARRSTPPEQKPSLSPERAVPIIEELIRQASELDKEDRNSSKVTEWAQTAESALIAAFGNYNTLVQSFGREFHSGVYYQHDSTARRQQQFQSQMQGSVAVLQSAVKQLRWQLADPSQVFLPAGSQHDAYVEIRNIVQTASTEIFIVDPYVDDTLWQLLTNLPPAAKVRVLTEQMKGDFSLEAKKFVAQHGNTVEIRQTSQYHDRFIITDGKRCWHLGASIKDTGNKTCAISEFLQAEILNFVKTDAETRWAGAKIVAL